MQKSCTYNFPSYMRIMQTQLSGSKWCRLSKNLAEIKRKLKNQNLSIRKSIMRVCTKPIIWKVNFDVFLLIFFTSNFLTSAKISGKVSTSPKLFWQKASNGHWSCLQNMSHVECCLPTECRLCPMLNVVFQQNVELGKFKKYIMVGR